jgi:hypothetical protein
LHDFPLKLKTNHILPRIKHPKSIINIPIFGGEIKFVHKLPVPEFNFNPHNRESILTKGGRV